MATKHSHNLSIGMFLKPIYFIAYKYQSKFHDSHFSRIFIRGRAVFYLLLFNIVLFAGIGRVIFLDSNIQNDIFNNFQDGTYNLFILMTTANFPDVMLPYFIKNRWAAMFFILFLFFNTVLILNMVLAVFYASFKAQVNKDSPDRLSNSKLHESNIYKSKLRDMSDQFSLGLKSKQSFHQNHHNQLFRFLSSKWVESVMGLLSLVNFLMIYVQCNENNVRIWILMNVILNIIFLGEEVLIIMFLGKSYYKRWQNVLSCSTTLSQLLLLSIFYYTGRQSIYRAILFLTIYRAMRILSFVMKSQEFSMMMTYFFNFIPYFGQLFGMLIMIFFTFIAFGQHLFGGKMNSQSALLLVQNGLPSEYIYNNFNDFGMGMVMCWDLLMVNNWNIMAQTYRVISNSQFCEIFFALFYIVAVLLALNVTVAFLIDYLVKNWEEVTKKEQIIS